MRISDWSSDVCSSDLRRLKHRGAAQPSTWITHIPQAVTMGRIRPIRTTRRRFRLIMISPIGSRPLKDMASSMVRSEEHTSELQSLMRISYAVFCLKKKKITKKTHNECVNNNIKSIIDYN